MATHSSSLAWKSHEWRSLVGYSPCGCEELDTTERLHFHFSLSHIGEGNGSPLQCSCLENPKDGGAWWPAIYGVAQSRTRLKQLSSSSSSSVGSSPKHLETAVGSWVGSRKVGHHGKQEGRPMLSVVKSVSHV